MIALPSAFCEAVREMLGSETAAFLHALEEPAALALRINPLRPGAVEAAALYSDAGVPWEPMGYYLKPGTRPGASVEHAAGAFYLQEASAMLSAAVLDPIPGEKILDLCAAPGGKTTQILGRMNGKGLLISNEYEPSRAKVLAANLERMGAVNAIAVNARPDTLAARWPEFFDAVLCDAPCSGEGMFRRDPESRMAWSEGSPDGCAARQAEILDSAAELVRPGGRLVYSTCTFNRTENEDTIRSFLSRHPDFSYEDFAINGIGTSEEGMMRIWPHRSRGDGHFCARLRKTGSFAPAAETIKRTSREDAALIQKLTQEVCTFLPAADMNILRIKDYLYAVPRECPDLTGIRTVKPGLCLLRIGKNYIEPEHSLAMAIDSGSVRRTTELTCLEAIKYMAGETLTFEAEKGWTLITYKGLPLGWGKASNGQIKNHLPKGLRLSLHPDLP